MVKQEGPLWHPLPLPYSHKPAGQSPKCRGRHPVVNPHSPKTVFKIFLKQEWGIPGPRQCAQVTKTSSPGTSSAVEMGLTLEQTLKGDWFNQNLPNVKRPVGRWATLGQLLADIPASGEGDAGPAGDHPPSQGRWGKRECCALSVLVASLPHGQLAAPRSPLWRGTQRAAEDAGSTCSPISLPPLWLLKTAGRGQGGDVASSVSGHS